MRLAYVVFEKIGVASGILTTTFTESDWPSEGEQYFERWLLYEHHTIETRFNYEQRGRNISPDCAPIILV